jgi:hypothetical protein
MRDITFSHHWELETHNFNLQNLIFGFFLSEKGLDSQVFYIDTSTETILPWDQCNLVDIWIRNPQKFESCHFVLQIIIYDFRNFSDLLKSSNRLSKKNTRWLDLADLGRVCRCSGYRGIPVHLLLGPAISPSSAQGIINGTSHEEDPHEEAPHEENDDRNC